MPAFEDDDDLEREDFRRRFQEVQDDLRAYCLAVCRDWVHAEDIVQETALILWQRYGDYDATRPFGAWARGVATRRLLKHRERQARQGPVLSSAAVSALADAAAAATEPAADQRLEALQSCLKALDERQRRLVDLRFGQDLPLQGVAAAVGAGVEAVGKALQRLRDRLGDCVQRRLAQGDGR